MITFRLSTCVTHQGTLGCIVLSQSDLLFLMDNKFTDFIIVSGKLVTCCHLYALVIHFIWLLFTIAFGLLIYSSASPEAIRTS